MRFRTWPVAALGLASLLLLVVYSVLTASGRAQAIYTQLDALNSHHRDVDTKLRRLRSDLNLSGIFVRDYLLDAERAHAEDYRQRLSEFRSSNLATLTELRALLQGRGDANDRILSSLQIKLEDYWEAFEPLIDWTTGEKISRSAGFLRREVLPRREAAVAIADEIEELNDANLADQRASVTRQHAAFRDEIGTLLWRTLFLGVFLAVTVAIRLRVLERRSEEQKALAQNAERQLRLLSQQLVAAQEEERRKLSRELHDHVGQMLTALRMELGRVDRLGTAINVGLASAVAECRKLVDEMVHLVRDLALGLRPSMLDDIGLQPTLEWQARDFTRRYNVRVELDLQGDLDGLSDQHRTCVYRVIQEALTNCIRHAHAGHIHISVHAATDLLEVSVTDDGVGMDFARRREGLGLRGIEERARELGGTIAVQSTAGKGATLTIRLPLAHTEQTLARAAG